MSGVVRRRVRRTRSHDGRRVPNSGNPGSLTLTCTTVPASSQPGCNGQGHTPGELVEYESHVESKWLTLLDFDPAVVAFATQPSEFDGVDGRGAWCLFVRAPSPTP